VRYLWICGCRLPVYTQCERQLQAVAAFGAVVSWTNYLFIAFMSICCYGFFGPYGPDADLPLESAIYFQSCISVTFESTFYFYLVK